MALNELNSAAVNSITMQSSVTQCQMRHSDQRLRFCPRYNRQCAPESFMRIDHFGNASSAEYCTDYCQYDNLWKCQNVAIADSETPQSLIGLSNEETAECYCCEKSYGISEFQKLLTDGRVKVLKTCQSYRLGNNQYRKQRCLKVDVDYRTTNPNIPTFQNNNTNNIDYADLDVHLAAIKQVQNPFACIP
jgi:hypothetical protein